MRERTAATDKLTYLHPSTDSGQAPAIRTQAIAHTFTDLPGERYTFRVTATDHPALHSGQAWATPAGYAMLLSPICNARPLKYFLPDCIITAQRREKFNMTSILIVDDDVSALRLVGLTLERRGYEIQAATSGEEGLEKVGLYKPDLIILDVMMPGMDGYEVAQQLRENPETTTIPILFFTAKTSITDKISGFQVGGDDYLTKPAHPVELISRVEALLQRSVHQMPEVKHGQVCAFLPAKGGVGNSTLALNAALELCKLKPQHKVILIELTDGGGSLALQTGTKHQKGLQALIEKSLPLSHATVDGQLQKHTSGLYFLPSTSQPAGIAAPLTKEFVHSLFQIVLVDYDYVVLDLPPALTPPVSEVLKKAEYIVLTLEPNKIALQLATLLMENLEKMNIGRYKIAPVVIHRAPTAGSISRELLEKQLDADLLANIPPAPDMAYQSWDNARPMVLLQPQSLVAQQVRLIVNQILKAL